MATRRRITRPTLLQQLEAFRLPDQIIAALRSGEIETINDKPCFRDLSESAYVWYEIAPAIGGWVSLWRRLCERYRLVIDLRPVELVARRLELGSMMHPEDIDRAAAVFDVCRHAYRAMDVYEVRSIVKTECIAQEQERLLAAGAFRATNEVQKIQESR